MRRRIARSLAYYKKFRMQSLEEIVEEKKDKEVKDELIYRMVAIRRWRREKITDMTIDSLLKHSEDEREARG